jgi:hypothetical protein
MLALTLLHITAWNEFMFALTLIDVTEKRPRTLASTALSDAGR